MKFQLPLEAIFSKLGNETYWHFMIKHTTAEILKNKGYKVETEKWLGRINPITHKMSGDFGVDVYAENEEEIIICECWYRGEWGYHKRHHDGFKEFMKEITNKKVKSVLAVLKGDEKEGLIRQDQAQVPWRRSLGKFAFDEFWCVDITKKTIEKIE